MDNQNNTPTAPQEQKITRRQLLKGIAAAATIAALPAVTQAPTVEPLPRRDVLAYLETYKAQLEPFNDLMAYIEKAAYLPADQIKTDLLVELWRDADDALVRARDVIQTMEFEESAFYGLVGKDNYQQACYRVMPGYEL